MASLRRSRRKLDDSTSPSPESSAPPTSHFSSEVPSQPPTSQVSSEVPAQPFSAGRGGRGGAGRGGAGRGGGRGRGRGGKLGLMRQNSAILKSAATVKGRGSGKRKISGNPFLQAAYDRQRDLKVSYKSLARIHKIGLSLLSKIDYQRMEEDPKYHEKLPAFREVAIGLEMRHKAALDLCEVNNRVQTEYLPLERDEKIAYAKQQYVNKFLAIQDDFELRCKEAVLKLLKETVLASDNEYVTTEPDDDTDHVKSLLEDTEVVAADDEPVPRPSTSTKEGTPRGKKRAAEGPPVPEPAAKRAQMVASVSELQLEGDAPESSLIDFSISKGRKSAKRVAEAAAPGEPAPKRQKGFEVEDFMKDNSDQYGVIIPNKKRRGQNRPNNRAVFPRWFDYEDGEIGLRSSEKEEEGKSANPRAFFFDQGQMAEMTEDDFDQALVKKYNLHPRYGIPLPPRATSPLPSPSGQYPDPPPTNFANPLPRYNPVVVDLPEGFVDQTKPRLPLSTEVRPTYRVETSRSTSYMHIEEDWADLERRMNMRRILGRRMSDMDTRGLATFDADARDKAKVDRSVEEILEASRSVEVAQASSSELEVSKTVQQVLQPTRALPGALEALADVASHLPREVFRHNPAMDASFVRQTSVSHGAPPFAPRQSVDSLLVGPRQPQQMSPYMAPPSGPALSRARKPSTSSPAPVTRTMVRPSMPQSMISQQVQPQPARAGVFGSTHKMLSSSMASQHMLAPPPPPLSRPGLGASYSGYQPPPPTPLGQMGRGSGLRMLAPYPQPGYDASPHRGSGFSFGEQPQLLVQHQLHQPPPPPPPSQQQPPPQPPPNTIYGPGWYARRQG